MPPLMEKVPAVVPESATGSDPPVDWYWIGLLVAVTPWLNEAKPLDWACASTTNLMASNRGMISTPGTLPGRYMPADCR